MRIWDTLKTLWRTAEKLTELERAFGEIQEEWFTLVDRLERRDARDRKRRQRDMAKGEEVEVDAETETPKLVTGSGKADLRRRAADYLRQRGV